MQIYKQSLICFELYDLLNDYLFTAINQCTQLRKLVYFSNNFITTIIQSLKINNLNELQVSKIHDEIDMKILINLLKSNPNLQSLEIDDVNVDTKWFEELLKSSSNLTTFSLESYTHLTNELTLLVPRYLKKLTHLTLSLEIITTIDHYEKLLAKLPNLKTLSGFLEMDNAKLRFEVSFYFGYFVFNI